MLIAIQTAGARDLPDSSTSSQRPRFFRSDTDLNALIEADDTINDSSRRKHLHKVHDVSPNDIEPEIDGLEKDDNENEKH